MIELRRARPLLGTRVEIAVTGDDRPRLLAAIGRAFAEITAIHALLSFQDAASELSRLNREAYRSPQPVDRRTRRVVALALGFARATGGAFDPTLAPHLVAAGLLPWPAGAPQPDPRASVADVELSPDGRISYRRPLWLDFGGVAKGYAVDRAVAALRRHGVRRGRVDAGGDLRVFGDAPVRVALRDSRDGRSVVALLALRDRALASSSPCFSRDRTGASSHLVTPGSGEFLVAARGASVIARRCALADAWTKGVLFDPARAASTLPRLGASALVIEDAGIRWLAEPAATESA